MIGDQVFVRLVLFCFDFRISDVVYFYLCMLVYISASRLHFFLRSCIYDCSS